MENINIFIKYVSQFADKTKYIFMSRDQNAG